MCRKGGVEAMAIFTSGKETESFSIEVLELIALNAWMCGWSIAKSASADDVGGPVSR